MECFLLDAVRSVAEEEDLRFQKSDRKKVTTNNKTRYRINTGTEKWQKYFDAMYSMNTSMHLYL